MSNMQCTQDEHDRLRTDPRGRTVFRGVQQDDAGIPLFELHDCPSCGSTLAIPLQEE